MTETTADADLTARIRSGPAPAADAALDELYRRHRDAVLAYARHCTLDAHTAEDLTSEAFARALHAVRGGSGPSAGWRPYLLATVRRTAGAWARTARRTELSPDFETWLTRSAPDESGEESLLRREDEDLVLRAFHSLPERWQTALWHSTVERESPDRIAPLLGLTPSGAASLTARAREGLREAYLAARVADTTTPAECRHFTGLLAASLRRAGRGRRGARGHRGLERHLADCPRCRRAGAELRELNSTLTAVLPVGVLLWAGGYGIKAGSEGAVAVSSAAAPAGIGAASAPVGVGAALKAGAVGASVIAVFLGGYAVLPDRGEPPPQPLPVPTATTTGPNPEPTRERGRDRAADPKPSRKPSRTPSSRDAGPPPSWSPAAADRVTLPVAATGRCMDIAAGEGAEPYESACDGGRSQRWELLVDRAAQEVRIRNYATGMCLTHTGTETDGAPVRQRRGACKDDATTARWTYFRTEGSDRVAFAQKGSSLYFLGLDDWHEAAEGERHDPDIGTTANYYNSPSLRFRYEGTALGG